MPPRVRRLVLILTAGAAGSRLFVLGQEHGWALVAPAAARVTLTALAAWLAHMVLHELAHWAAAGAQGFLVRRVRFAWLTVELAGPRPRLRLRREGDLGGGVSSLPRGGERLPQRLRRVALAGPAATFAATAALGAAWGLTGASSLASPLGIFFVMGAFVLVTALLPGALLPVRPESGSDLEQILQPRRVLAHWTNAAALEAVLRGARLEGALDWRATASLLPETGPTEPFELGWCYACLEAGELDRASSRLDAMASRFAPDAPDWLITDVAMQRGLLAALHRGDVPVATACLAQVVSTQSLAWYAELLRAALAHARGDPAAAAAHLGRWTAPLDRHPQRAGLVAGNRWALARLGSPAPLAPVADAAVR